MYLIVHTQYKENYGDAENPYWKFKGGETYAIKPDDCDPEIMSPEEIEIMLARVAPMIEYKNDFSESYIVSWAWSKTMPRYEYADMAEEMGDSYDNPDLFDMARGLVSSHRRIWDGDRYVNHYSNKTFEALLARMTEAA